MTELETKLLSLVKRYRYETPIGNQPHMICHVADEAIAAAEAAQPVPGALCRRRYVMSETSPGDYRLIIGFSSLAEMHDARHALYAAESEQSGEAQPDEVQRAVEAEREACARLCEDGWQEVIGAKYQGDAFAHSIRARGNKRIQSSADSSTSQ